MKLKELVFGFSNTIPDSENILNRLKAIRDAVGGVQPTPTTDAAGGTAVGVPYYGAIADLDKSVRIHSRIAKEISLVVNQIIHATGSGNPVRPCPIPVPNATQADPDQPWDDEPSINLIDVRIAFQRINSDLMDSRDNIDHLLDFLAGPRLAPGSDSKREQSEGLLGELGLVYAKHNDILEDYSLLLGTVENALGDEFFVLEESPRLASAVEMAKSGGIKAFVDGERRDDLRS